MRRQRIQNKQRWTDQAKEEFDNYQHDPLFIFGVALYWAEGFKTGGALGLTNSDPEMIKVWLKWHHKYFSGLKVRGKISAHDDVKEKEAIDFWSGLGIKDIKLYRANPSSSRGKSPGRLPHGTLQVITKKGSLEAFTKMMVWIDMISNTFI